ncbi:hypothetical protein AB0G49_17235 [Streptomyces longwoodensis]|uniref:hypothetical protein n=1 Tax=Streptomyces longwoodensis TaxID=68231 RepID=UPI0033E8EAFB
MARRVLTRLAVTGPHRPPDTARGARMRLRRRATAAVVVSSAIVAALAPQAMAAPMPWETSRTPTTLTRHPTPADSGTATVLCAPPCYQ